MYISALHPAYHIISARPIRPVQLPISSPQLPILLSQHSVLPSHALIPSLQPYAFILIGSPSPVRPDQYDTESHHHPNYPNSLTQASPSASNTRNVDLYQHSSRVSLRPLSTMRYHKQSFSSAPNVTRSLFATRHPSLFVGFSTIANIALFTTSTPRPPILEAVYTIHQSFQGPFANRVLCPNMAKTFGHKSIVHVACPFCSHSECHCRSLIMSLKRSLYTSPRRANQSSYWPFSVKTH